MLITSGALLTILAGYSALCAIRPFGPCRKCSGTGLRDTGRLRRGAAVCRRCHGQRYRLRIGRRAWNAWHRTRTAGTRPNPLSSNDQL